MKYLYIDTSSSYLYTAVVEEDRLLCEVKSEFGHNLSEVALPEIVEMFNENNIKPEEIGKIIVVNGPGSFTGIRIGITIAKVYAWTLHIPISTITSLEAMALSLDDGLIHIPVLDARRGYVFAAIYDNKMSPILKPSYIKLEELQEKMHDLSSYKVISNDDIDLEEKVLYDANLLRIVNYAKEKEEINPHAVNPDYLKLTEAEENK